MAFTSHVRHDPGALTRAPDLVRWGPVIAGVAIGLGFFALVNTLWLAIAYSAGDGWVSGNLAWFVGVSAAVSLLLAGLIAGLLAGVRGMLAGMANGVTAWAVVFILSLTTVIPGAMSLTGVLGGGLAQGTATVGGGLSTVGGGFTVESALWTMFWSLLAGLALAAIGGVLGGRMRRPVELPEDRTRRAGTPPVVVAPADGAVHNGAIDTRETGGTHAEHRR